MERAEVNIIIIFNNKMQRKYSELELRNVTFTWIIVCKDTDAGRTDVHLGGCDVYEADYCGLYDDNDFQSSDMCCICGGGKGKLEGNC